MTGDFLKTDFLLQRPIPQIGPKDVLIEVKATGICGSDVHYLNHARIGDFVLGEPMVLGHESAGIIHSVGEKVTSLQPGDRVALEPGETCMGCSDCKCGKYNVSGAVSGRETEEIEADHHLPALSRYHLRRYPAEHCRNIGSILQAVSNKCISLPRHDAC